MYALILLQNQRKREREREREKRERERLAYLDRTLMRANGHSFFITARRSPTF